MRSFYSARVILGQGSRQHEDTFRLVVPDTYTRQQGSAILPMSLQSNWKEYCGPDPAPLPSNPSPDGKAVPIVQISGTSSMLHWRPMHKNAVIPVPGWWVQQTPFVRFSLCKPDKSMFPD